MPRLTRVLTRVFITGANAGVGCEAARQLALQPGIQKVILACRNPEKAQAAKESLEKSSGKTCFEVLILDMSNLASVQKAVNMLIGEIDCLILNAGGFVGQQPTAQTEHGTMKILDLNVLGHVFFTDLLLKEGKLCSTCPRKPLEEREPCVLNTSLRMDLWKK